LLHVSGSHLGLCLCWRAIRCVLVFVIYVVDIIVICVLVIIVLLVLVLLLLDNRLPRWLHGWLLCLMCSG
jgi:hypothetical protein